MRKRFSTKIIAVLLVLLVVAAPLAAAESVAEKRQDVRDMAEKTLSKLYEVHPSARGAVDNAVGYAVFSSYGIKLFVLGGGRGKGILVSNWTGEELFMKMAQVDVGIGLGVKDFNVIFVFETEKAFDRFKNQGWEFGGQATVAATDSVSGGSLEGAVSIWPGAWMYQMTERGLAFELTGKGTRYYKDSDLN